MNIDIFALECFLAVADTRSFTRAAEQVEKTQSAVSQQVSKLERSLGASLLQRDRSLHLTPEGEVVLSYARQIISLQRELCDRFHAPDLAGELRFGLSEDFASMLLSSVLAEFPKLHPRVVLHVECDLTLNLCRRYESGEFDLVLVKLNQPSQLRFINEIWSEPLVWVGDVKLLERDKIVPLVLSPEPCVYRAHALGMLQRAGLGWRIAFTSSSYASTLAAIQAGLGLGVLPQSLIPPDVPLAISAVLPKLENTHVSLVKREQGNALFEAFSGFVSRKFHHLL